jgi:hypothetical protein
MRRPVIGLLLAGLALMCAGVALAATHATKVTPKNFEAIFNRGDNRPVSNYAFVRGPGKPPLGKGSLQLTTVDAAGKQQHLETQQQGAPIADVDQMSYWTYRHAESTAPPVQVVGLNMEVLGANTGTSTGYATFVYEPVYNAPPPVVDNTWQSWDAYRGGSAIWWSTRTIAGVGGVPVVCSPSDPNPLCVNKVYVPWSVLVAANPDATILSYGVNQGSGSPGLIDNTDALSIGVNGHRWVYDFEPCGKGHGHHHGHGKGCEKPKHH